MRIAFVVSEFEPLAKVGGLADVAGSLPRALSRLGHEVVVVLPRYASIPAAATAGASPAGEVRLRVGAIDRRLGLSSLEAQGTRILLLEEPALYGRPGVYGEDGKDYPDNAERFAVLSLGALEAIASSGFEPEVLHCHDWQTALVPVYLEMRRGAGKWAPRPGVLLTIHNLAYQGIFEKEWMERLGLPAERLGVEGFEFHGRVNLLKGGLFAATLLSTVSPTYAREIQTAESGCGLDGVLRARAADLRGVLNGIDTEAWDPAGNAAIPSAFTADDPSGKRKCKNRLQRELGLRVNRDAPLVGAIGRLDPQKGFDLVAEAAPYLLDRGAELVVLGAGDPAIANRLRSLGEDRPRECAVRIAFDADLARRIYAGADLFVMPSRFEPCGLGQMIAMRYGTIPVVRATGGLADTVRDADSDPQGEGFVFEAFGAEAFRDALDRALTAFDKKARWGRLVDRAMRRDFSWERSARVYVSLYEECLRRARGA